MDLAEAREIEDIVDENIEKHHKIIDLEKNSIQIKATFEAGEKRMNRMEVDITTIKDNQSEMSLGIASIKQSLDADNGIRDIARSNTESIANLKDSITVLHSNCKNNKELLKKIPAIEKVTYGIVGIAMFSGVLGLIMKVAGVI